MTIINVTSAPYSASGNGNDDDTAAIQAAINDATDGDGLYFPKGNYLITQTLHIDANDISSIMGDSVHTSQLSYKSADNAEVLSIFSEGRNSLKLGQLHLFGGKVANTGLKLSGQFHHQSRIHDVLITGIVDKGINLDGHILGGELNNISVSGGQYGLYCEDTVRLNAASIHQIRISNTQTAALFLRNPKSSSVHHFTLYDPVIEGNNGLGIDVMGGILLRIIGGHFEANAKRNAECDIQMGRFSSETRALCVVNLHGTMFSAPSENQGQVRIKFDQHGAQLKVVSIAINAGSIVDMNNKLAGSIVHAVMPTNTFHVINGPPEKVHFWP